MRKSARWKEHNAESKSITVKVENEGERTIQYKEIYLDPASPTYRALKQQKTDPTTLGTLTTLKYTIESIGSPLSDSSGTGYPLYIGLHGGGGTSTDENNELCWHMTQGYRAAIKHGIWIAARGLGDSWDLHFTSAGYVLIERLIENMILFQNVNPNRVNLIGFSAGGDGVYRLATRLAQRFGAVNMGGGDPGGVRFDILSSLPICLQVGEEDEGLNNGQPFHRNQHVAKAGLDLDGLRAGFQNLVNDQKADVYTHDVFIHPGADHFEKWEYNNFWGPAENIPVEQPVIDQYKFWHESYTNVPHLGLPTKIVDTNAVRWVDRHPRNPIPQHLVWDLTIRPGDNDNFHPETQASLSGKNQHYWLDIGQAAPADVGPQIKATIDTAPNAIIVYQAKKYLRILLRPDMGLDLMGSIQVHIDGQVLPIRVGTAENRTVIQYTLIRNDPNLIFTADVILNQDGSGRWSATKTPIPQQKALL